MGDKPNMQPGTQAADLPYSFSVTAEGISKLQPISAKPSKTKGKKYA